MVSEQEEHRRLLEGALAAITVGVLVIDGAGCLVLVNDAAREMVRRMHWPTLHPGEPVADPPWGLPGEAPLAGTLGGKDTVDAMVLIQHEGEPPVHLRFDCRPLFASNGEVAGAALVFRDASLRAGAQREVNEQLLVSGLATREAAEREKAARAEAEAALKTRDDFLEAAAHGLKTPVASLRGFARLALEQMGSRVPPDPEHLRHVLEVIDQQATALSELVSQLLDVSCPRHKGLPLHPGLTWEETVVMQSLAAIREGTAEDVAKHSGLLQPAVDRVLERLVGLNYAIRLMEGRPIYRPLARALGT